MSRKLASIQRITDIREHPNADTLELAFVLGWQVCVKKGEFKVGDLAVYMEIDSVPPDEPEYRFLWRAEVRPNNFRIKTIRLRGQLSQGILFPIPSNWERYFEDLWVGSDVTEHLGVTKYEPALPRGSAEIAGQFFDGVPKTDEDRVQSRHDLLATLQGRPYYITVKCDGASMTVAMHDGVPKVASRNCRLADSPDSAYWNAARNADLLSFVSDFPHLAVQGELVGPGVQNNRLGLPNHRCLVFNVYDRDLGIFWPIHDIIDVGLPRVPTLEMGPSFAYTQDDLLRMAEGKYDGTTNEREGIVIRSNDPTLRISFKAISNRFLLKGGE